MYARGEYEQEGSRQKEISHHMEQARGRVQGEQEQSLLQETCHHTDESRGTRVLISKK